MQVEINISWKYNAKYWRTIASNRAKLRLFVEIGCKNIFGCYFNLNIIYFTYV